MSSKAGDSPFIISVQPTLLPSSCQVKAAAVLSMTLVGNQRAKVPYVLSDVQPRIRHLEDNVTKIPCSVCWAGVIVEDGSACTPLQGFMIYSFMTISHVMWSWVHPGPWWSSSSPRGDHVQCRIQIMNRRWSDKTHIWAVIKCFGDNKWSDLMESLVRRWWSHLRWDREGSSRRGVRTQSSNEGRCTGPNRRRTGGDSASRQEWAWQPSEAEMDLGDRSESSLSFIGQSLQQPILS
jgi:hypothetical protein